MTASEPIVAGEFFFDPEDFIYKDHFPGNPVVPGSLIIAAFMIVARPMAESVSEALEAENFRFRHFISPGRYAFRVAGKDNGSMHCTLYDGGRRVVTGILWSADSSC